MPGDDYDEYHYDDDIEDDETPEEEAERHKREEAAREAARIRKEAIDELRPKLFDLLASYGCTFNVGPTIEDGGRNGVCSVVYGGPGMGIAIGFSNIRKPNLAAVKASAVGDDR